MTLIIENILILVIIALVSAMATRLILRSVVSRFTFAFIDSNCGLHCIKNLTGRSNSDIMKALYNNGYRYGDGCNLKTVIRDSLIDLGYNVRDSFFYENTQEAKELADYDETFKKLTKKGYMIVTGVFDDSGITSMEGTHGICFRDGKVFDNTNIYKVCTDNNIPIKIIGYIVYYGKGGK